MKCEYLAEYSTYRAWSSIKWFGKISRVIWLWTESRKNKKYVFRSFLLAEATSCSMCRTIRHRSVITMAHGLLFFFISLGPLPYYSTNFSEPFYTWPSMICWVFGEIFTFQLFRLFFNYFCLSQLSWNRWIISESTRHGPFPSGCYSESFTAFGNAILLRGENIARYVRSLSATLDPEQPCCIQPLVHWQFLRFNAPSWHQDISKRRGSIDLAHQPPNHGSPPRKLADDKLFSTAEWCRCRVHSEPEVASGIFFFFLGGETQRACAQFHFPHLLFILRAFGQLRDAYTYIFSVRLFLCTIISHLLFVVHESYFLDYLMVDITNFRTPYSRPSTFTVPPQLCS